jgi:hypothetical protein
MSYKTHGGLHFLTLGPLTISWSWSRKRARSIARTVLF